MSDHTLQRFNNLQRRAEYRCMHFLNKFKICLIDLAELGQPHIVQSVVLEKMNIQFIHIYTYADIN